MTERDGFQAGVPCWVENWSDDLAGTAAFYAGLLGWEVEAIVSRGGGQRLGCTLRGRDVAALATPVDAGDRRIAGWITFIWVDNVEDAVRKAADAQGHILIAPSDSFDGGRMALLEDPAGAVFGTWQPGSHRGAGLVNEPGAWTWSGLETADPEGSNDFYTAVFGWDTTTYGGGSAMWHVPGYVGGQPTQPVARDVVAGMSGLSDGGGSDAPRSRWLVDFWVEDADATANIAVELGGTLLAPPFDTSVGRSAALADPHGAEFTVSRIGPPR